MRYKQSTATAKNSDIAVTLQDNFANRNQTAVPSKFFTQRNSCVNKNTIHHRRQGSLPTDSTINQGVRRYQATKRIERQYPSVAVGSTFLGDNDPTAKRLKNLLTASRRSANRLTNLVNNFGTTTRTINSNLFKSGPPDSAQNSERTSNAQTVIAGFEQEPPSHHQPLILTADELNKFMILNTLAFNTLQFHSDTNTMDPMSGVVSPTANTIADDLFSNQVAVESNQPAERLIAKQNSQAIRVENGNLESQKVMQIQKSEGFQPFDIHLLAEDSTLQNIAVLQGSKQTSDLDTAEIYRHTPQLPVQTNEDEHIQEKTSRVADSAMAHLTAGGETMLIRSSTHTRIQKHTLQDTASNGGDITGDKADFTKTNSELMSQPPGPSLTVAASPPGEVNNFAAARATTDPSAPEPEDMKTVTELLKGKLAESALVIGRRSREHDKGLMLPGSQQVIDSKGFRGQGGFDRTLHQVGSSLGSRGKQSSEVKSWKAAFVRDLVLENSDPDLEAYRNRSPSPAEFEQIAEYAKNTTNHTQLSDAWRGKLGEEQYKKMMAVIQQQSEHRFDGRMRGRKLVSANAYSRRQQMNRKQKIKQLHAMTTKAIDGKGHEEKNLDKVNIPKSKTFENREVFLMNTGYCRQVDQLKALASHVRPGGGMSPRSHRKKHMRQLTLCAKTNGRPNGKISAGRRALITKVPQQNIEIGNGLVLSPPTAYSTRCRQSFAPTAQHPSPRYMLNFDPSTCQLELAHNKNKILQQPLPKAPPQSNQIVATPITVENPSGLESHNPTIQRTTSTRQGVDAANRATPRSQKSLSVFSLLQNSKVYPQNGRRVVVGGPQMQQPMSQMSVINTQNRYQITNGAQVVSSSADAPLGSSMNASSPVFRMAAAGTQINRSSYHAGSQHSSIPQHAPMPGELQAYGALGTQASMGFVLNCNTQTDNQSPANMTSMVPPSSSDAPGATFMHTKSQKNEHIFVTESNVANEGLILLQQAGINPAQSLTIHHLQQQSENLLGASKQRSRSELIRQNMNDQQNNESDSDASARMPTKKLKKHNRTASGSRSNKNINRGSKTTRFRKIYDSRDEKLQIDESGGRRKELELVGVSFNKVQKHASKLLLHISSQGLSDAAKLETLSGGSKKKHKPKSPKKKKYRGTPKLENDEDHADVGVGDSGSESGEMEQGILEGRISVLKANGSQPRQPTSNAVSEDELSSRIMTKSRIDKTDQRRRDHDSYQEIKQTDVILNLEVNSNGQRKGSQNIRARLVSSKVRNSKDTGNGLSKGRRTEKGKISASGNIHNRLQTHGSLNQQLNRSSKQVIKRGSTTHDSQQRSRSPDRKQSGSLSRTQIVPHLFEKTNQSNELQMVDIPANDSKDLRTEKRKISDYSKTQEDQRLKYMSAYQNSHHQNAQSSKDRANDESRMTQPAIMTQPPASAAIQPFATDEDKNDISIIFGHDARLIFHSSEFQQHEFALTSPVDENSQNLNLKKMKLSGEALTHIAASNILASQQTFKPPSNNQIVNSQADHLNNSMMNTTGNQLGITVQDGHDLSMSQAQQAQHYLKVQISPQSTISMTPDTTVNPLGCLAVQVDGQPHQESLLRAPVQNDENRSSRLLSNLEYARKTINEGERVIRRGLDRPQDIYNNAFNIYAQHSGLNNTSTQQSPTNAMDAKLIIPIHSRQKDAMQGTETPPDYNYKDTSFPQGQPVIDYQRSILAQNADLISLGQLKMKSKFKNKSLMSVPVQNLVYEGTIDMFKHRLNIKEDMVSLMTSGMSPGRHGSGSRGVVSQQNRQSFSMSYRPLSNRNNEDLQKVVTLSQKSPTKDEPSKQATSTARSFNRIKSAEYLSLNVVGPHVHQGQVFKEYENIGDERIKRLIQLTNASNQKQNVRLKSGKKKSKSPVRYESENLKIVTLKNESDNTNAKAQQPAQQSILQIIPPFSSDDPQTYNGMKAEEVEAQTELAPSMLERYGITDTQKGSNADLAKLITRPISRQSPDKSSPANLSPSKLSQYKLEQQNKKKKTDFLKEARQQKEFEKIVDTSRDPTLLRLAILRNKELINMKRRASPLPVILESTAHQKSILNNAGNTFMSSHLASVLQGSSAEKGAEQTTVAYHLSSSVIQHPKFSSVKCGSEQSVASPQLSICHDTNQRADKKRRQTSRDKDSGHTGLHSPDIPEQNKNRSMDRGTDGHDFLYSRDIEMLNKKGQNTEHTMNSVTVGQATLQRVTPPIQQKVLPNTFVGTTLLLKEPSKYRSRENTLNVSGGQNQLGLQRSRGEVLCLEIEDHRVSPGVLQRSSQSNDAREHQNLAHVQIPKKPVILLRETSAIKNDSSRHRSRSKSGKQISSMTSPAVSGQPQGCGSSNLHAYLQSANYAGGSARRQNAVVVEDNFSHIMKRQEYSPNQNFEADRGTGKVVQGRYESRRADKSKKLTSMSAVQKVKGDRRDMPELPNFRRPITTKNPKRKAESHTKTPVIVTVNQSRDQTAFFQIDQVSPQNGPPVQVTEKGALARRPQKLQTQPIINDTIALNPVDDLRNQEYLPTTTDEPKPLSYKKDRRLIESQQIATGEIFRLAGGPNGARESIEDQVQTLSIMGIKKQRIMIPRPKPQSAASVRVKQEIDRRQKKD